MYVLLWKNDSPKAWRAARASPSLPTLSSLTAPSQTACASSSTGAAAMPAVELAALLSTPACQAPELPRVVFKRQYTDQGVFHTQPFTTQQIAHLGASRAT